MSVPQDIIKLLGERDVQAYVSLSTGLSGPIGETCLVVADSQMFVFTRDSLIGEFEQVALDSAHPPKLEKGGFSDTLHIGLKDGTAYQLNVSSFERDNVSAVLEAATKPHTVEDTPASEPKEDAPASPLSPLGNDTSEDSGLIDLKKISVPEVAPMESINDQSTRVEKEPSAENDAGIYYGSDPGCAGCLMQLVAFFGATVLLWFGHELALEQVWVFTGWNVHAEGVFVLTKIIAVVGGVYLGARAVGLLNKMFKRLSWPGRVMFKHNEVHFMGIRNNWTEVMEFRRPFKVSGLTYTMVRQTNATSDKPAKHNFTVFICIEQDGRAVYLRTTEEFTDHPAEYHGIECSPIPEAPKQQKLIMFQKKELRSIAKRLVRITP